MRVCEDFFFFFAEKIWRCRKNVLILPPNAESYDLAREDEGASRWHEHS